MMLVIPMPPNLSVPCSIVEVNGGWSVAMWLCAECRKAREDAGQDVRQQRKATVYGRCDDHELIRQAEALAA